MHLDNVITASLLPAKSVVSEEMFLGGGNKTGYPACVMPLRGSPYTRLDLPVDWSALCSLSDVV